MRYKDLIQKIQKDSLLDEEQTSELVKLTSSAIANILAEGDALAIKGFGTFEVKKQEERISVNPATGNRWMIPPKLIPIFKPSTLMKGKLKTFKGYEQ